MDYYLLTDLAATMGYHLAMSGAETFRVEDTVHRILGAYGIECEVFAIPNSISVSLEAANGKPLMVLRRHRLPRKRPRKARKAQRPEPPHLRGKARARRGLPLAA